MILMKPVLNLGFAFKIENTTNSLPRCFQVSLWKCTFTYFIPPFEVASKITALFLELLLKIEIKIRENYVQALKV
jgi:hypothetical protein